MKRAFPDCTGWLFMPAYILQYWSAHGSSPSPILGSTGSTLPRAAVSCGKDVVCGQSFTHLTVNLQA